MKFFENTCEFQYPWDQVTAANWRKYPNEVSTHVVAVDVLRREINPATKQLTTERLITCKQSIPGWLLYLVGGKEVSYVREISIVDLNEKTLTLRSINMTMNHLLKVYETVTYSPDQKDPLKTVFKQEAQITAYATFQKLCNKLEDWGVQRFDENAKKGKKGFDSVLSILNEQWDRKDILVDEIAESIDKVVKTVDSSIGSVVKKVDKFSIGIVVKSVDSSIGTIKEEIVKETDKVLSDAEHVKKSLLNEYYDYLKAAFRKNN